MSSVDNLQQLIATHQRRLQLLREQNALYGKSVDPHIPIEIENIEAEIEKLRAELLQVSKSSPDDSTVHFPELQRQRTVLEQRLHMAQTILGILETKAASFPLSEMPATLLLNLQEKRNEVNQLQKQLASLNNTANP